MKVKVCSLTGADDNSLREIDLDESVFGVDYDDKFMSMYFSRMKASAYVPTNKTRNISEISGTTKKPYKQKHTGNARQGSCRSAQMRGGGVAFGPRAVKGFIKIPKSEARLAKMMLLSEAVRRGVFYPVDKIKFSSVKTKDAVRELSKFSKMNVVLISEGDVDASSLLAVRNVPGTRIISRTMLTASDLFYANAVLMEVGAIEGFCNGIV